MKIFISQSLLTELFEMPTCPPNHCGDSKCLHCQYNAETGQQTPMITFKDLEQQLVEKIARELL